MPRGSLTLLLVFAILTNAAFGQEPPPPTPTPSETPPPTPTPTPSPEPLFVTIIEPNASTVVTGPTVNATGTSLPGATITVQGPQTAVTTSTQLDGFWYAAVPGYPDGAAIMVATASLSGQTATTSVGFAVGSTGTGGGGQSGGGQTGSILTFEADPRRVGLHDPLFVQMMATNVTTGPEVTVGGRPMDLLPFADIHYVFMRVTDGTEGEGVTTVRATINEGSAPGQSRTTTVVTDFTAPSFSDVSVVPAIATTGTTIQIGLTASESLDLAPNVLVGGRSSRLVGHQDRQYSFEYTVPSPASSLTPSVIATAGWSVGPGLVVTDVASNSEFLAVLVSPGPGEVSGRVYLFDLKVPLASRAPTVLWTYAIPERVYLNGSRLYVLNHAFALRYPVLDVIDLSSSVTMPGRFEQVFLVDDGLSSFLSRRQLEIEGTWMVDLEEPGDYLNVIGVRTIHDAWLTIVKRTSVPPIDHFALKTTPGALTAQILAVSDGGLLLYSVNRKGELTPQGSYHPSSGAAHRVYNAGDFAVVGCTTGSADLIDVSNPFVPRLLSTVSVSGVLLGAWRDGSRLVMAMSDRLVTVDVEDPTRPRILSESLCTGSVRAITRSGPLAVARDCDIFAVLKMPPPIPEGTQTIRIEGLDLARNPGVDESGRLEVDYTPPTARIVVVAPNPASRGTTVTIDLTASEPLRFPPVVRVAGKEAPLRSEAGLRYRFGRSIDDQDVEGPAAVEIDLVDLVGIEGHDRGRTVDLDFTPPAVAGPVVVQPAWAKSGTAVTISFSASEALSTTPVVTIGGLASSLLDETGLGYRFGRTVAGQEPEGVTTIQIKLTDRAGNQSQTTSGTATYDFTLPELSGVTVAPTLTKVGSVVRVGFSSSETLGTTPTVKIGNGDAALRSQTDNRYEFDRTIDGSEGEGLITVSIRGEDRAGNVGINASASLTTDFTAPEARSISATPAILRVGSTLTVSFSTSEPLGGNPEILLGSSAVEFVSVSSGVYTYRRQLDGTEEQGTRTIRIRMKDVAGNEHTDPSASVVTDFTPPVITNWSSVPSLARVGTTVAVSFDVSEPLAADPVVSVGGQSADLQSRNGSRYMYLKTITGAEGEGAVVVSGSVVDLAGNPATDSSGTLTTDFTAPKFTQITATPAHAMNGTTVVIEFLASEPLSENPAVTIGGKTAGFVSATGARYKYSRELDKSEGEGQIEVKISGIDVVGNPGTSTAQPLVTDFTVPNAQQLSVSPARATTGTTVTITFSASESLRSTPTVTLAGQPTSFVTKNGLDFVFRRVVDGHEGEGTAVVRTTLVDVAGNTGHDEKSLILDFTAPTFTFVSVEPTPACSGTTVAVTVDASETLKTDSTLTIGSRPAALQSHTGLRYQFSRRIDRSEGEGTPEMRIVGEDLTGISGTGTSRALTTDFTPPAFTALSVEPSLARSGTTVTVYLTASETLRQDPTVTIGGQPARRKSLTDLTYTYQRTLDATEHQGTATVAILGVDLASNGGQEESLHLETDFTAPRTRNLTVTPDRARVGTAVLVQFSTSETLGTTPTVHVGQGKASLDSFIDGVYRFTRVLDGTEDEGTATVTVVLENPAGNVTTDTSGSLVTDFKAPTALDLSATPTVLKSGTKLTVTFSVSESLGTTPTVLIGTSALVLGSHSGNQYTFVRTLDGTEGEGSRVLGLTMTDLAGNVGVDTHLQVTTDFTAPTFRAITPTPAAASIGTTVTVTFDASETLAGNPAVTIGGRSAAFESRTDAHYSYRRVIDGQEGEGQVVIRIEGADVAGNAGLDTSTNVTTDFTKPAFSQFTASPTPATTGTTVEIAFDTSETLKSEPTVTIGGQVARFVSLNGSSYRFARKLDSNEGEGHPVVEVRGVDSVGNAGTTTAVPLVTDFTAPTFLDVQATPSPAMAGTTVTISFGATEELRPTPAVFVGGKPAAFVALSNGRYTFVRKIDKSEGEGHLQLSISGADLAGNSRVSTFDPLVTDFTPPQVTGLAVNPTRASTGTTLTITFSASESLQSTPEVTVGGKPASLVSKADLDYTFHRVVDGTEGEGTIAISADLVDVAGNPGHGECTVVLDLTPPAFTFASVQPALASTGTTVAITIEASEPLSTEPTLSVGPKPADLKSQSGLRYVFERRIDGSEGEGTPEIRASGRDLAGNRGSSTSRALTTDLTAPDFSASTLDPTIGCSGTAITVNVTSSEPLEADPMVLVDSKQTQFVSRSGLTYRFQRTLDGTEHEGADSIVITGVDLAGNGGQDSHLRVTADFTPPAYTAIALTPSSACVGTTVGVAFDASETLGANPTVKIGDQPATFDDRTATHYKYHRVITGQEGEGVITVRVEGVDVAGNTGVDDSARVTTDFTKPQFSSFAASPTPATTGTTVEISFDTSEDLEAEPAVTVGGQAARFVSLNGSGYRFARRMDGSEGEGRPVVEVRGVDSVGNAGTTTAIPLETDFKAPRISDLSVTPSRATTGTTVSVSFVSSEDVGALPTVTVAGHPATLASQNGRSFVYEGRIVGTEAEGAAEVLVAVADRAGNVARIRATGSLTLDFVAPTFGSASVDPSLARAGTTVTVSFVASEPLAHNPDVLVGGLAASFVSVEGLKYRFVRTLSGEEAEGQAAIVVRGVDVATVKGENTFKILTTDFTAPSVRDFWAAPSLLKVGSTLNVSFSTTETLASTPTVSLASSPMNLVFDEAGVYTFRRVVDGTEGVGSRDVRIRLVDPAGNVRDDSSHQVTTDFTGPSFLPISVSPMSASSGTSVEIAFRASEALGGTPIVLVGSRPAVFVNQTDLSYAFRRVIDGSEGAGAVEISVTGSDLAGNSRTDTTTALTIDLIPPQVTLPQAFPSEGRSGTLISISFGTSEPVTGTPEISIGGRDASFKTLVNGVYHYERTLDHTEVEGQAPVRFVLVDLAGNRSETSPISVHTDFTAPTSSDLSAEPSLARAGTTVTVRFTVSETLGAAPIVRLGSQPTTLLTSQHPVYAFTRVLSGTELEGSIKARITLQDRLGNVATTDSDAVTTDFTPPSFQVTSVTTGPCAVGEVVVVQFSASETLATTPVVRIGTSLMELAGQQELNYAFTRTLDGTEQQGVAPISIEAVDLAGNAGTDSSAWVELDFTAPAISGASVTPRLATQGTTVSITFSVSETLETTPEVLVGGLPAVLESTLGTIYTFARTLTGDEDEGDAVITIFVMDRAGNITEDTSLKIQTDFTAPAPVITVFRVPACPVLLGPPIQVCEGQEVSFFSGGSTDNTTITSIVWSLSDGETSTASTIVHRFADGSTHQAVSLLLVDAVGKQASAQVAIDVVNVTPTINAGTLSSPARGITTVTWQATDPGTLDNLIVDLVARDLVSGIASTIVTGLPNSGRYAWDTTAWEESTFQLLLTVKDKDKASATASTAPTLVDNRALAVKLNEPSPRYFNPLFGEKTSLPYFLSEHATVRVVVVRSSDGTPISTPQPDTFQPAGSHAVQWNGRDAANGEVLGDGQYAYVVTATDQLGSSLVVDSSKAGYTVVLDTTPPAAPVVTKPPSLTNKTPLELVGTKEQDTGITVTRAGEEVRSPFPDASQTWSLSVPLVEGLNELAVLAKDRAGNRSTTVPVLVVLDTIAPTAPVITSVVESPTHQASQTVSGTKEPNTALLLDGVPIVPLGPDTTWSTSVRYMVGTTTFGLTVRDEATNLSEATIVSIELLPNPVAVPQAVPPVSPTTQLRPTLVGTKQANTSVVATVVNDDGTPGQSTRTQTGIDATTAWTLTLPLSEGSNSISLQSFDSVGSRSPVVSLSVAVDTKPPVVTLTGISADTLTTNPNLELGMTYSDASPSCGLDLASARMFVDGQAVTNNVVVTSSSASVSGLGLAFGSHAVSGTVQDLAGNRGTMSATLYVLAPDDGRAPSLTIVGVEGLHFSPSFNPYDIKHERGVALSYKVDQPVTGTLKIVTAGGNPVATVPVGLSLPGMTYTTSWSGRDVDAHLVKEGYYDLTVNVTNSFGRGKSVKLGLSRVHY